MARTNEELAKEIDTAVAAQADLYAGGDTQGAIKGIDAITAFTDELRAKPDAPDVVISHPPEPVEETTDAPSPTE